MSKRIKLHFLFLVILIVLLLFFPLLIGCTGGRIDINIPMLPDDIVGFWEGDLALTDRNGTIYESTLEIGAFEDSCFATFTALEKEENEVSGFMDISMDGTIVANKLHLISPVVQDGITYEATFAFSNFEKTIRFGFISRFSTDSTESRATIDTWQGNLEKWIDPDKQPISFEDPNLENAVRNAAGYTGESTGAIYPGDVSGINQLDIENCHIESLAGVQHLKNLRMLNVKRNDIEDLTPLKDLVNLKILNVSANPISDLTPLENIVSLESLRFYETQVNDLAPIQQLIQLKTLDFADAQVNDLAPINNLINVTYLNCGYNRIGDISPLKYLVNLQSLWLINNQIDDISPLVENQGLGEGHYVDIRNNLLDLTPDSEDMQNIETLINRGVTVFYETL